MLPPKRLLDQVRDWLRLKNYAYRTEKPNRYWIKQYILFHNKRGESRPLSMPVLSLLQCRRAAGFDIAIRSGRQS